MADQRTGVVVTTSTNSQRSVGDGIPRDEPTAAAAPPTPPGASTVSNGDARELTKDGATRLAGTSVESAGSAAPGGGPPGGAGSQKLGGRLASPGAPMSDTFRRLIGVWLFALTIAVVGHFLWAWSTAYRLVGPRPHKVRVHWLWWAFEPTAQFSLLLIVGLAAMLGSMATMTMIFANRSGHRKLEERWEYWYLYRPLSAAGVGILFYVVVVAGLLGATAGGAETLVFAAATGGLAGLFTDRVIAAMRQALGASPFNVSASDAEAAKKTGGTNVVGVMTGSP